jgi:hypothetical protein
MLSAAQALELLRQGNRRFVSDVRSPDRPSSQTRRRESAAGQSRSRSSSGAPIRACRRRSSSIRAWGISS